MKEIKQFFIRNLPLTGVIIGCIYSGFSLYEISPLPFSIKIIIKEVMVPPIFLYLVMYYIRNTFIFGGLISKINKTIGCFRSTRLINPSLEVIKYYIDNTDNIFHGILRTHLDICWERNEWKLCDCEYINERVCLKKQRRHRITSIVSSLISRLCYKSLATETQKPSKLVTYDHDFRRNQLKKLNFYTNAKRILFIKIDVLKDEFNNQKDSLQDFIDWHNLSGEYQKFQNKLFKKSIKLKIVTFDSERIPSLSSLSSTSQGYDLDYDDFVITKYFPNECIVFAQKDFFVRVFDSSIESSKAKTINYIEWFNNIWSQSNGNVGKLSNEDTSTEDIYAAFISKEIKELDDVNDFIQEIDPH